MDAVQSAPSELLHPNIPKILNFRIAISSMGKVIGPGGKNVNDLIALYELDTIHLVDKDTYGEVQIVGADEAVNERCKAHILDMIGEAGTGERPRDRSVPTEDTKLPDVGTVMRGLEVVKVVNYGVFVEVDAAQELDGLILIKDLDPSFIKDIDAMFKVGDKVDAKVLGISQHSGKLLLSRRALLEGPQTGPDDDLTKPGPGVTVPERGTTLRDLEIVSVRNMGVQVRIDENLHAFIYLKDLDTKFISDIRKAFQVGEKLDANVRGLVNGRLLLSRRELLDAQGGPEIPSVPAPGTAVPEAGTVLRNLKVSKVLSFGIFVEVNPELLGLILMRDLDSNFIRDISSVFQEGDTVDAKVVGLSPQSGKLLLSRKAVIEEEGGVSLGASAGDAPASSSLLKKPKAPRPDGSTKPKGGGRGNSKSGAGRGSKKASAYGGY